jgi:hypothetical protein
MLDDQLGRRKIRGERHIAYIAYAQQALDIGLVRVSVQRVDEKQDGRYIAYGYARRDLSIAAHCPRQVSRYGEPGSVSQALTCLSRRNQTAARQGVAMLSAKRLQRVFHAIVCYQRDRALTGGS